ncbi:hypothetical protein JEQ12_013084 [Ovis aries]|uniref:USP domain-containing protein n=1 Tax=Ovis aries TaxID=9940 RepID=A0A835ZSL4_SHEEP|nr:hypothetical protein JEQ12_013084 [Ovis aries]
MQAHVTRALLHAGEVIRPHRDLLAGFHRHQQEDAHEFLTFTLNGMQQGCLSASQQSGHASEDTSVVRQIFGGTWRSQIQCLHCLGVSDTFDPYLDISLDITAAQSVEQALRELVKPEKLEAENAYDCGVCLRKVPATKRLTLHRTSQVLVLVLKRFTQLSGAKRAQEVRYPQCLDVQPYTSERKAGPLGYVLYAVLVHSGWSCERGHYLCYIRAGSGQWYKMDDAKVTACDETAALSQSAYVLLYAREDQELLKRQGPLVIFSTVLTTTESPGIDCSSKAQPATPTWCLLVAHASIAGLTGTFIQVFKNLQTWRSGTISQVFTGNSAAHGQNFKSSAKRHRLSSLVAGNGWSPERRGERVSHRPMERDDAGLRLPDSKDPGERRRFTSSYDKNADSAEWTAAWAAREKPEKTF